MVKHKVENLVAVGSRPTGLQQQCALNSGGDDAGSGASEYDPRTASEATPAARLNGAPPAPKAPPPERSRRSRLQRARSAHPARTMAPNGALRRRQRLKVRLQRATSVAADLATPPTALQIALERCIKECLNGAPNGA